MGSGAARQRCTAFALTGAVAFLHGFVGSQLWLYYKERDSWGTGWGLNGTGYFTLPHDYLASADLATDAWVITACSK
jgi:hypothetical protein